MKSNLIQGIKRIANNRIVIWIVLIALTIVLLQAVDPEALQSPYNGF